MSDKLSHLLNALIFGSLVVLTANLNAPAQRPGKGSDAVAVKPRSPVTTVNDAGKPGSAPPSRTAAPTPAPVQPRSPVVTTVYDAGAPAASAPPTPGTSWSPFSLLPAWLSSRAATPATAPAPVRPASPVTTVYDADAPKPSTAAAAAASPEAKPASPVARVLDFFSRGGSTPAPQAAQPPVRPASPVTTVQDNSPPPAKPATAAPAAAEPAPTGPRLLSPKSPLLQNIPPASPPPAGGAGKSSEVVVPPVSRQRPGEDPASKAKAGKGGTAAPAGKAALDRSDRSGLGAGPGERARCAAGFRYDAKQLRCVRQGPATAKARVQ